MAANQAVDWEDPCNGQYIEVHRLAVYLEDAVDQFLRLHPSEQAKSKVAVFFRDYFQSVRQGSHVLLREYSFVSVTPYNRACVVGLFWQTYKTLSSIEEIPTGDDYHSLLRLLWPEFPQSMVLKAIKCVNDNEEGSLKAPVPFVDFLYAFQTVFCLQDFLEALGSAFGTQTGNEAGLPPQPSSPETEMTKNGVTSGDGLVNGLAEEMRIPIQDIKEIAHSKMPQDCKSWWPCRTLFDDLYKDEEPEVTTTSLTELHRKLTESEAVTLWIGKLPVKKDCEVKKIIEVDKEAISDTVAISWPKTEQVSVRKPRLFSSRLSSVLREDSAGDSESDSSSGEPVVGRRFRSKSAGTGARSRSRRFK